MTAPFTSKQGLRVVKSTTGTQAQVLQKNHTFDDTFVGRARVC